MTRMTHMDMADAIADVAIGAYPLARWSDGYGCAGEAERTRDGIDVRHFDREGNCIASTPMSASAVDACVRHARRSAA